MPSRLRTRNSAERAHVGACPPVRARGRLQELVRQWFDKDFATSTPEQMADEEKRLDEFLRTATALAEAHLRRFCENHDTCCPLHISCIYIICDGNHKLGMLMCDMIELRHLLITGVGYIPYGCEKDPLPHANVCKRCLNLLAIRTPRAEDAQDSELPVEERKREFADPGRADAVFWHTKQKEATQRRTRKGKEKAGAGAADEAFETNAQREKRMNQELVAGVSAQRQEQAAAEEAEAANAAATAAGAAAEAGARQSSASASAKRAAAKSMEERVAQRLRDAAAAAAAAKEIEDDEVRFAAQYGDSLDPKEYLEEGVHAYELGSDEFLLDQIVGEEVRGGETLYIAKFRGWTKTYAEPATSFQQHQLDEWAECKAKGVSYPTLDERIDRIVADNPNLPRDAIAPSSLQFEEVVKKSVCCRLKIHQRGEPPGGYHRRAAGMLVYVCGSVIPLFYMWMVNSESIMQVMFGFFKIARTCPTLAARLKGTLAKGSDLHATALEARCPDPPPVLLCFPSLSLSAGWCCPCPCDQLSSWTWPASSTGAARRSCVTSRTPQRRRGRCMSGSTNSSRWSTSSTSATIHQRTPSARRATTRRTTPRSQIRPTRRPRSS